MDKINDLICKKIQIGNKTIQIFTIETITNSRSINEFILTNESKEYTNNV